MPTDNSRSALPDVNVRLRVPVDVRDLIDAARACVGQTRTEFVVGAAKRRAAALLADRRMFTLDAAGFAKFMDVLDNPPIPNESLRRLMARKAPWDVY